MKLIHITNGVVSNVSVANSDIRRHRLWLRAELPNHDFLIEVPDSFWVQTGDLFDGVNIFTRDSSVPNPHAPNALTQSIIHSRNDIIVIPGG